MDHSALAREAHTALMAHRQSEQADVRRRVCRSGQVRRARRPIWRGRGRQIQTRKRRHQGGWKLLAIRRRTHRSSFSSHESDGQLGLRAFCFHLGFSEVMLKSTTGPGRGTTNIRPIEYDDGTRSWDNYRDRSTASWRQSQIAKRNTRLKSFTSPLLKEISGAEGSVAKPRDAFTPRACQEDVFAVMAHVKRLMVLLATRLAEV